MAAESSKPAHIATIYLEGDGEGGEALGKEPDDGVAEKDLVSLHSTSVSLALVCAMTCFISVDRTLHLSIRSVCYKMSSVLKIVWPHLFPSTFKTSFECTETARALFV